MSLSPWAKGRHLIDGCPVCEARKRGEPSDYDVNHRLDRIYVTTNRRIARGFAAGYPRGALYAVEPLGPLEDDPEHPESFAVERARVTWVADPCVILRPNELRRWFEDAGITDRRVRRARLLR